MKLDVKSMSYEELAGMLAEWGEKPFRARQLFRWLHKLGGADFSQNTTFPKALREECAQKCYINSLTTKKKLVSDVDGTVKYLYELFDGNCVETVLMHHRHGASLCLSTQVGCRMGCRFCASTQSGLLRNLTPAEMLDQVYASQRDSGEKLSSLVLMGIGEPLDNYDNVIRFLELISHPEGFGMSLRHVSLSTCGLVDKIEKLSSLRMGLTLSVSLHAANDETRNAMMPVNRKYPVAELIAACKAYFEATGRRVSFEYALIEDVNDTPEHARELKALLAGFPCHVNLIPVNPVPGRDYRRSGAGKIAAFQKILESGGLAATVRRELGTDIMAACGQLRYAESMASK